MDEMNTELACPHCGSTTGLATTERLEGASGLSSAYIDAAGNRHYNNDGRTEINWDSSTTIGFECTDCGWAAKGIDAIEKLAIVADTDEDDEKERLTIEVTDIAFAFAFTRLGDGRIQIDSTIAEPGATDVDNWIVADVAEATSTIAAAITRGLNEAIADE